MHVIENEKNQYAQQRKHPRYEVPYTVAECVLTRDESEVKFTGLICNYSKSGICLHTSQALDTGQTIRFQSKEPRLSETAIVRWFKNESICSFRVGLEFI